MTEGLDARAARRSLSPGDYEERTRRLAEAVAREEAVLFAYIFGSFAEGRAFEDVDVAVFIGPERTGGMDLLSFQLDLAARLEEGAGLPVGVVLLDEAPLGLRAGAARGRPLPLRDDG